jgi:hypothetical protein
MGGEYGRRAREEREEVKKRGSGQSSFTVMELFSPWMVVICWHSLLCVNQPNFWFHSFSKFVSPWAARSCTRERARKRQQARPLATVPGRPPPDPSHARPTAVDVVGEAGPV